jgi:hypothetical protein
MLREQAEALVTVPDGYVDEPQGGQRSCPGAGGLTRLNDPRGSRPRIACS